MNQNTEIFLIMFQFVEYLNKNSRKISTVRGLLNTETDFIQKNFHDTLKTISIMILPSSY